MERHSKFEKRLQVDVPKLLEALGIDDTRRNGRSIEARCPSHPDRNPSWSIVDNPHSSRNGLHWCFSCQFGGGPVALVKQVRQCTTAEAFEWLRGSPKREVALDVDVVVERYGLKFNAGMRVPSEVKIRPFEEWPEGARDYLLQRGVNERQVVVYDIGFATEGRLAGRIIFPMKNEIGQVQSYTARDWTGRGKRYLEPRSQEGANKNALFGEHVWKRKDVLVVAEGCFDALAIERHKKQDNFEVCALHGSRLHPVQAMKLADFWKVVVATDSDPAGDSVAQQLQDQLARYCRNVVRMRAPEGEDCASMPAEQLSALLDQALA